MENNVFWSEIESGFGEPGSTPPGGGGGGTPHMKVVRDARRLA